MHTGGSESQALDLKMCELTPLRLPPRTHHTGDSNDSNAAFTWLNLMTSERAKWRESLEREMIPQYAFETLSSEVNSHSWINPGPFLMPKMEHLQMSYSSI